MLLKKGTVFYPKDDEARGEIISYIEKNNNFRVIGYNQYIDLKTKGEPHV